MKTNSAQSTIQCTLVLTKKTPTTKNTYTHVRHFQNARAAQSEEESQNPTIIE